MAAACAGPRAAPSTCHRDCPPFGTGGGIFDTQDNDITLATALTGGGGLIKDGTGTLTLAADPTYTGITVVVAGKLIVNGSPDGPIAVGAGAEIEINGDATSLGLGGDGNMRLGTGNLTLNVEEGVFTSFNGTLVTTGGVIKNGLGTQAFAGPNTFAGGLTINAGVLQTNGDAGLGASNGFVKFNGGTLRWGLPFDIGGTREITLLAGGGSFDVSIYTTTITQGISGNGALTKLGIGILSLQGTNTFTGANTFSELTVTGGLVEFTSGANLGSGSVTLDGGGLQWAAGSTLDLSLRLNALGTNGGTLDTSANNIVFTNGLSGGALTKHGSGTLSLQAANSFSSLVLRDGFVEFATSAQLGSGSITLNGGGLRWTAGNTTDLSARLAPIGPIGSILDTGVNNIFFDTTLTGTGILVKTGDGKLTLTGIAHTGGTHVAEGTLEAHVTTSASTRLTGSGIFVKNGPGALTLDAGTYYTGVTTVTQGSLIVNGYNLATTTVQNGATLGGSGVLGYVTLQNGATLASGNSPGTLTLASNADGSFDFQSGSTVQMEITLGSGPSDLLNFIGNGNSTLSFLSSLTITANTLVPTQSQTFNLLDWSGLTSAPTFANHFSQNLYRDGSQDNGSAWDLPDISASGLIWDLSLFTTHGTIQIVPEPARAVFLMLGLVLVALPRRRSCLRFV